MKLFLKNFLLVLLVSSSWLIHAESSPTNSPTHEFEKFPWLVKVSSTYQDLGTEDRETQVTGHGFIIEAKGKFFVITAAHLSQGGVEIETQNLSLESFDSSSKNWRKIEFLQRLAHNRRDIEVIEIAAPQNSQIALAKWMMPQDLPYTMQRFYPRGALVVKAEWKQLLEHEKNSVNQNSSFVALSRDSFFPRTKMLNKAFETPLSILSTLEFTNFLKNAEGFFQKQTLVSGLDATDGELISILPTNPGMSGLPLLHLQNDYLIVKGLVSSSSRNFSTSWFAQDVHIIFTLQKLLDSLPPSEHLPKPLSDNFHLIGDVYWRMNSGVQYRVGRLPMPDRQSYFVFEESQFLLAHPLRKQNGNGVRADGGNGVRADGGNGTRADGAIHSSNSENVKNGVMKFSLGPQINFKSILGFKVELRDRQYLVPADMPSVNFLLEQIYTQKIPTTSLQPIYNPNQLFDDMNQYFSQIRFKKYKTLLGRIDLPIKVEKLFPLKQMSSQNGSLSIQFVQPSFFGSKDYLVYLKLKLFNKTYEFQIPWNDIFSPMQKTIGGESMKIDLASLLFTSTSTYNFSWNDYKDQMPFQLPNPELRFQMKSQSGEEFLIYFAE